MTQNRHEYIIIIEIYLNSSGCCERKTMLRDFLKKLDHKYLKVCLYAAVTVLLTVIVGAIAFSTGPFWSKLWSIFTAVLKPIIIGGIIWYLLDPVVKRFEKLFDRDKKHKWSRAISVLLTFAIIAAIVLAVLTMLAISIYKNVGSLDMGAIKDMIVKFGNDYAEIMEDLEQKLSSMNFSTDGISKILKGAAGAVESFFSGLMFGIIFSIYFLLDENDGIFGYWRRAFRLIFGDKHGDRFREFAKDADNAFSGYIRGQLVDATIVGILATISLSIAGVPYAAIVGVCIGFGNLIPYFGPIVGYVATVLVCLPSGAFDKMIIGLVIIVIIMFVDGNVINPKLLSDNVDVHPLLVVAALIAGGAVGGIAGMLIAVPSAALVKMQFDRYLESLEKRRETEKAIESK